MRSRFYLEADRSSCLQTPRYSALLPRSFYERGVLQVARDCIGMYLVSRIGRTEVVGRIVETEAYRGPQDKAAHSYMGRRTQRTEVMFGRAGHAYVFMLYGMHHNFNLVTGRVNQPQAVLVRAVEPVCGRDLMAKRRGLRTDDVRLTNGPGKLCRALGIHQEHYGLDLTQSVIGLSYGPPGAVRRSPRIGIDYAEEWADKPWRFYEPDNPYVSKARRKE